MSLPLQTTASLTLITLDVVVVVTDPTHGPYPIAGDLTVRLSPMRERERGGWVQAGGVASNEKKAFHRLMESLVTPDGWPAELSRVRLQVLIKHEINVAVI